MTPTPDSNLAVVVLAAGLGTRLRPITESIPKPLVPFFGIPSFYLALSDVYDLQYRHVAINTHHLSGQVSEAANRNPFGLDIHISHETELMGSGGAFDGLRGWAENRDLLTFNGDVITDLDPGPLIARFRDSPAVAGMALVGGKNPKGRSVWLDRKGYIRGISQDPPAGGAELTPHIFSGTQILSPEFVEMIPRGEASDVISVYERCLSDGLEVIGVHAGDCRWYDIGTPRSYLDAHIDVIGILARMLKAPSEEMPRVVESLTSAAKAMGLGFDWVVSPEQAEGWAELPEKIRSAFGKAIPHPGAVGLSIASHGAKLDPAAEIGPSCFFGKNTVLGADAQVRESIFIAQDEEQKITGKHHRSILFGSTTVRAED